MTIKEQRRNQVFNRDGTLYSEEIVEIDVTAEVNELALHDQARLALQANRDYIALVSPTNAQVAAQVKLLTRQMQGVLHLVLREFEVID